LYIVGGGGAITWNPGNPGTAFQQMFVDATGAEGQTVMNSAISGPGNDIWFSGYGAANGGGFIPTQDEVAKFVPR
jgi:hypothetical protein